MKLFFVISFNALVQNNGKRGCLLKVLYQELSLKMFIGISTYFGVAWDRLIASIGWIPVTKVVSSKLCGVKRLYEYSYNDRICFANYDKVH